MRILIAPDKFKGCLTAAEVADAMALGVTAALPDAECDLCPIADGGEGTLDAAIGAGFGEISAVVSGPTGEPVTACYARKGDTAVIEMAAASGLALLPGGHPAPMRASSRGTGELIKAALDAGARQIVIAVGGSACTDGGAGMIAALGGELRTPHGEMWDGGGFLQQITGVDLTRLHPALSTVDFVLASDVDNPLLGPHGAASMYAPQKGASPAQVRQLEEGLSRWAAVVSDALGVSGSDLAGAGAAGGVGYAALTVLRARPTPGIDAVLELVGFTARLKRVGLVLTGEGSLDEQTLRGKGPAGVAGAAKRVRVPAIGVAGRVTVTDAQARAVGFHAVRDLLSLEPDPARSMANAAALVERVTKAALSEIDVAALLRDPAPIDH